MPTSRVRANQPFPEDNFEGQNGYLYAFKYWLEDGTYGVAKHQEDAARFTPGEDVSYEVTREFKGVKQLKLSKPGYDHQGAGGQRPPADPRSAPQSSPQPPSGPRQRFLGATIGNCLTNAVTLLSSGVEPRLEGETTAHAVYRIASSLLLVAETIDGGRIHGEKKAQASAPPQPPQPPPPPSQAPPPPPPPTGRQQHQPGPGGLAFDPNDLEEDVPF